MDEVWAEIRKINERLDALERDSHPPVDLRTEAYQAMASVLREATTAALAKSGQ